MELQHKSNLAVSLLIFFISFGALAQSGGETTEGDEVQSNDSLSQGFRFEPPHMIERSNPSYPSISARVGDEGWVVINTMVDTEGNAYEAMVVESRGGSRFEKAALDALLDSKFEPAKLNGDLVDGSTYFKYIFALEGGVGATPDFRRKYILFNEKLAAGNSEEARELLGEMEELAHDNLYENAFYNLSSFYFFQKEQDYLAAMESLEGALAYSPDSGNNLNFLSEEILPVARSQLFMLQVHNKYYGEAYSTFRWMMDEDSPEIIEPLQPYYDQVLALRTDSSAYEVRGEIDALSIWDIKLHKNNFALAKVAGKLDELKLRCNASYRVFPFQEDVEYTIPESWGLCSLQIVGDPGATFSLIQLPPIPAQ